MYSLAEGGKQVEAECDGEACSWAGGIARAIASGWMAWPDVDVDLNEFEHWLEQKWIDPRIAYGGDLYLAFALERQDVAALRAFDRVLRPAIAAASRAAGADATTAAEVCQVVMTDVLVGDEHGPRIRQFGGRGDLRGWLRSIAIRTTWRLIARARREVALDDEALAGTMIDVEQAHLRQRYAVELERAFAAAIAALTPRQRTLLRLVYVDGATVDVLGRVYAVHRATAARWVAAARDALIEEARRRLDEAVGAGLTSVLRLVESDVQLGLGALEE